MMTMLAVATSASPAVQIVVYVFGALIVASILGVASWLISISRRLNTQDKALAVIVETLHPKGSPSLTEVMTQVRLEMAEIKGKQPSVVGVTPMLPTGMVQHGP